MKAERRHDIHDYEKRVANAKRVVRLCKKISESNKKLLLKYADFKRAQGISLGRIAKFLYTLKTVAVILDREFKNATREDWIRVFAEIQMHACTNRPGLQRKLQISNTQFLVGEKLGLMKNEKTGEVNIRS